MFLGDDPPIELVAFGLLFLELLVPPGLESRKPLLEAARRAPIEPDRRLGQIREQPFVVADQDEGGSRVLQFVFQPLDRHEIEMVRRLVEQQDVRLRRQDARQRRPSRLAAGKLCRVGLGIHPEIRHVRAGPVRAVVVVQTGQDEIERRRVAGQIGLLRQVAQPRVGLREAVPPSAAVSPAAMRSSVDFPEPLRPTSAMRSPGEIVSSAPSSKGAPPSVRRMSRSCNCGAI